MKIDSNAASPPIEPLDPDGTTPLYHQLKEQLRRIAEVLPSGSTMPSEADLMAATGVSRATIRRAVADLVHEGMLRSKRGVGTFVVREKLFAPLLAVRSFTEVVAAVGRIPSTRILSFSQTQAGHEIAERLRLSLGAPVYALQRLRAVDGMPCMVERQFLPAHLVPGLTREDAEGSLYAVIEGRYGLRLIDGVETIQAVRASSEIASYLEVVRGSPILLSARITLASSGERVEFVSRHVRSDMWSFTIRLGGSAVDEPLPVAAPVEPLAKAAISEPLPTLQPR